MKKEFKIYHLEESKKIEYIKNKTNALNGIDLKEVKQIESDFWNNVYVLLNNGDIYLNGSFIDSKIDRIYRLDGINLYKITTDNKIKPLIDGNWTNLDVYLHNENISYKKIITDILYLVALTQDGKVIAVTTNPTGLGIIPENFSNVDDILMINIGENIVEPYIVKENKRIPLYVR